MPAQQFNAQADSLEATQPISDDAYTLSNVSVKSVNGKNDTSAGYQDVSFDMTLNPSKVKAGDYLDIHTGLKSNGEWYSYNSRLERHSDLTMNTGDVIGSVDSQGDYYRITFNSIVSHYQNAKASVDLKFSSYNQNAINTTLYTHDTKYKDKNLTYSPTNDAAIGDHYYTLGIQLPVEYYPESKSIEANQSASFAYYSLYGINWYQDNDGYLYTINNKDSLGGEIYPGEKLGNSFDVTVSVANNKKYFTPELPTIDNLNLAFKQALQHAGATTYKITKMLDADNKLGIYKSNNSTRQNTPTFTITADTPKEDNSNPNDPRLVITYHVKIDSNQPIAWGSDDQYGIFQIMARQVGGELTPANGIDTPAKLQQSKNKESNNSYLGYALKDTDFENYMKNSVGVLKYTIKSSNGYNIDDSLPFDIASFTSTNAPANAVRAVGENEKATTTHKDDKIPFSTTYQYDPSLADGQTKVITAGKNGSDSYDLYEITNTITNKVVYSKKLHENKTEPVNEVIGVGADVTKKTTRTINVTDPAGKVNTTIQAANLNRTPSVNPNTGKVTYSNWSTSTW